MFDIDDGLQVASNAFTGSNVNDVLEGFEQATAVGYDLVRRVKGAIAATYVTLRNICAVLMLAGLIFNGIKIIVNSNIPDKKSLWLKNIQNWVIGMILLIFSHVIMAGIFYLSDILVHALAQQTLGATGSINATLIIECLASWDSAEQILLLAMLIYMLYLTVIFTVSYFKRFMWLSILTVISPIVSIMYAFGDQTKRIYTKWLREYITSVLVQPFHLIVYFILVSIPLNIVDDNGLYQGGSFLAGGNTFLTVIYALVAMSFIRPAERYIRNLFEMDQGIANMASYDSGKQTIQAIKKTVTEVVKKVGVAVAAVATGGAAAGLKTIAGASGKGAVVGKATQIGEKLFPQIAEGKGQNFMDKANKLLRSGDDEINIAGPRNEQTDSNDSRSKVGEDVSNKPDDDLEKNSIINASYVLINGGNVQFGNNRTKRRSSVKLVENNKKMKEKWIKKKKQK